jgi:uncharacterized protein with HEPN domain
VIKYTKLRALAKAANSDGLLLNILTVYERAEEGWPPTRLALLSASVLDLLIRYPTLFAEAWVQPATLSSPFARHGFECGPGWFRIIDRLAAKLVLDPNLRVGQMKEEMGLLTVYFEASELAHSAIEAVTDVALVEAREQSRVTCEQCGQTGRFANRGHVQYQASVRCDPCDCLDKIGVFCRLLLERVRDATPSVYAFDQILQDSITLQLVLIGETAARLPPEVRTPFAVDWEEIIRWHEAGVRKWDASVLRELAENDVRALIKALE